MNALKESTILVIILLISSCSKITNTPPVIAIGAMRQVMMMGKLEGTIQLDTISNKTDLFGLGPIEYLKGEILILDGHAYTSTILADSSLSVSETYHQRAPFFVYTRVSNWKEVSLPDSIKTLKQIDDYLYQQSDPNSNPFAFRLIGKVNEARIHVVNLPTGMSITSPTDAHIGEMKYQLKNENVEIIGFFSRKHKTIFTHHDSFIHAHLITTNKKMMGHLDDVQLSNEIKFYTSR